MIKSIIAIIIAVTISLNLVGFASPNKDSPKATVEYSTNRITMPAVTQGDYTVPASPDKRDSLICEVCNRRALEGYELYQIIPITNTISGYKIGMNRAYTGELILVFKRSSL